MNLYKIYDPFFWKDQISVDYEWWAHQQKRADRLEQLVFLQSVIIGCLISGAPLLMVLMRSFFGHG